MTSRARIAAGAVALAAAFLAAPCAKAAPANVAAGYPDWQNVDKKHHLYGRELCPSDLRHKFTLVVEIDAKDREAFVGQIKAVSSLLWQNSYNYKHGTVWDSYVVPRNLQVVVSSFGVKDPAEMVACLAQYSKSLPAGSSSPFSYCRVPIYAGVTFPEAPDGSGKRPFFYLMGPEGTTPLMSGAVDGKTAAAVKARYGKEKKPQWTPFFGTVGEPKHFTTFKKALDPAKPKLAAEMAKLKKGIAARDPEVAKEAQILYDAVEQAKSDLAFKIMVEAQEAPHVAAADVNRLTALWPAEKKNVAAVMEKLKANPELFKAAQMYVKTRVWADPEFVAKNAGETKKILNELNQMKSTLEKMAENSKDLKVQSAASLVGAEIDTLIADIPSKVK